MGQEFPLSQACHCPRRLVGGAYGCVSTAVIKLYLGTFIKNKNLSVFSEWTVTSSSLGLLKIQA